MRNPIVKSHAGYTAWLGHRKKRKLGRYIQVSKNEDGDILFETSFGWSKRSRDKFGYEPFAVITKDNHAKVVWKGQFKTSETTERNAWTTILGFGATVSDKGNNKTHKVEFALPHPEGRWRWNGATYVMLTPGYSVPLTNELVIDLTGRSVIASSTNPVITPDRKASREIYAYARKCGDIYEVMDRLGTFDQYDTNGRAYIPYEQRAKAAIPKELSTLEEIHMATLVEQAFLKTDGYSGVRVARRERGNEIPGWKDVRRAKIKTRVVKEIRRRLQENRGAMKVVYPEASNEERAKEAA